MVAGRIWRYNAGRALHFFFIFIFFVRFSLKVLVFEMRNAMFFQPKRPRTAYAEHKKYIRWNNVIKTKLNFILQNRMSLAVAA